MTENAHANVGELQESSNKETHNKMVAGCLTNNLGNTMTMSLYDFIASFVEKNTLVRLWKKIERGNELILMEETQEDGTPRECCMEWQILSNQCSHAQYINCRVLGVTDIICDKDREAVNIVIDPDDKVSDYRFDEEHDFCRG